MDKRQVDLLFWALGLATLVATVCIGGIVFSQLAKIIRTEQIEVCLIPSGYFDEQKEFVTVSKCVKQKPLPKIVSKTFKPSKKPVNHSCQEALELCKTDKGCHARGCEELAWYQKGLNWTGRS